MASMLKIASFVAAAVLLLVLATPQARGWAPEEDDHQVPDMAPVQSPAAGKVMVPIPGAAGTTTEGSPVCLQCRCCYKSNPGNCKITTCCSSFSCDPAGKCHLVPGVCGCSGCGDAH
ncbi:hypothetical protein HU200_054583 [Digitaria exilis]|uniref:Uncharacterized protein n=1 Tax=Digitaria exilis TaxID=1010633 RepID=A0A835AI78_9POAL|nr:hypothetical protein HU200_054583 [Digitaria exilis]CAB3458245.1 unnamed protein product [Digitaria exilis]